MRRASLSKGAAIAAAGLLASASAFAAPPAPAPKPVAAPNAQAKLPYDVTADHGEVFNEEHKVIYTGNVVVIQGTDRLATPVLTMFFAPQGAAAKPAKVATPVAGSAQESFGKIQRMEAEGPVYFTTPTQNAKGDHGTYLASDDTTTLIGNVILVQDKDVSTGDKLVINRSNDHYTMYSNNTGKPVLGVFYQDDQPPPGGAAAKAPKPPGSVRP